MMDLRYWSAGAHACIEPLWTKLEISETPLTNMRWAGTERIKSRKEAMFTTPLLKWFEVSLRNNSIDLIYGFSNWCVHAGVYILTAGACASAWSFKLQPKPTGREFCMWPNQLVSHPTPNIHACILRFLVVETIYGWNYPSENYFERYLVTVTLISRREWKYIRASESQAKKNKKSAYSMGLSILSSQTGLELSSNDNNVHKTEYRVELIKNDLHL